MTPEEKKLLLKDLCCRLPYEVKIKFVPNEKIKDVIYVIDGEYSYIPSNYTILTEENIKYLFNGYWKEYKPYLFPLSSLTEEQKEEYVGLQQRVIYNSKGLINSDVMEYVNWCYKNHIDINNLIPMGLALDATGLNIY